LVLRVHVREGLQVHADGLKSAFANALEMALVEAGFLEVVPEGIITENVHAALHRGDLIECIHAGRRGLRGEAAPGGCKQSEESNG